MKANRIKLLLLFVSWIALAGMVFLRPSVGDSLETATVRPLEDSARIVEPLPPVETVRPVEAPVAAELPKAPVQSQEERGDAMLFESEALLGTPFDQAAVMPFD